MQFGVVTQHKHVCGKLPGVPNIASGGPWGGRGEKESSCWLTQQHALPGVCAGRALGAAAGVAPACSSCCHAVVILLSIVSSCLFLLQPAQPRALVSHVYLIMHNPYERAYSASTLTAMVAAKACSQITLFDIDQPQPVVCIFLGGSPSDVCRVDATRTAIKYVQCILVVSHRGPILAPQDEPVQI